MRQKLEFGGCLWLVTDKQKVIWEPCLSYRGKNDSLQKTISWNTKDGGILTSVAFRKHRPQLKSIRLVPDSAYKWNHEMLEKTPAPLWMVTALCRQSLATIPGEPMDSACLWPSELHQLQHPGTVLGGYEIPYSGKVTRSSVIPELVRMLNLIGNKRKVQSLSTFCLWSALQFLLHWNQINKQKTVFILSRLFHMKLIIFTSWAFEQLR